MIDTNNIMNERYQSVKLAVALRTARSVVGWSQGELASYSKVPKVTIARFETLEGHLRADQLQTLLDIYASMGVRIVLTEEPGFRIEVEKQMLELAGERLADDANARSDRKRGKRRLQ